MAYNTRSIKKDVDGRPIPQYFNPITDQYEPLYGVAGAARSVLYGPDGQPISASNRLPVDVGGTVDISDRADRQLGQVALSGHILHTVSVVTVTDIAPQETYQVEFDLGTDILVDEWWITFAVTGQVHSPIDNISLNVAYSRTQGDYSVISALVWSRTFGKSSGLVTNELNFGHLSGMPENRPMARYMRLRWRNNHASTTHVLRSVRLMARVPKGVTAPIQRVTT